MTFSKLLSTESRVQTLTNFRMNVGRQIALQVACHGICQEGQNLTKLSVTRAAQRHEYLENRVRLQRCLCSSFSLISRVPACLSRDVGERRRAIFTRETARMFSFIPRSRELTLLITLLRVRCECSLPSQLPLKLESTFLSTQYIWVQIAHHHR